MALHIGHRLGLNTGFAGAASHGWRDHALRTKKIPARALCACRVAAADVSEPPTFVVNGRVPETGAPCNT